METRARTGHQIHEDMSELLARLPAGTEVEEKHEGGWVRFVLGGTGVIMDMRGFLRRRVRITLHADMETTAAILDLLASRDPA